MKILRNKKIIIAFLIIILIVLIFRFLGNLNIVLNYLFNRIERFELDNKLSSVVIVGAARNIEGYLDKTFEIIEMISECFTKSHIIIYENDSTDKTLDKLNEWKNKNNDKLDISIITEKGLPGLRTQRLSYARNKLLDEAIKKQTEYLIVLDLDRINHDLTRDAFLSSFNLDVEWAGVFANQLDQYYDLWALRTIDDWLQCDCWECNNTKKDINYCVNSRFRTIDISTTPIEVVSAFGGIGIYKTKYLNNCHYYGGENDKEICEHVKFNKDIQKNNGKLYINPKMINSNNSNNYH